MTAQEFAQALRKMADSREASWDGNRYEKDWEDVAALHLPKEWQRVASVLLFPGYADVWDWCEEVDPSPQHLV